MILGEDDDNDDIGGGFDMPDLGDPVLGLLQVATEAEENVMGETVGQLGKPSIICSFMHYKSS